METIGYIAALGSAASWAMGTVVFEKIGKTVPFAGITFLKGLLSIVLLGTLTLCMEGLTSVNIHDFGILALSGIIGIAIGDTLFFRSLQDLGAKVQVLFFMLGQIVTMLLSFMFLGDVLSINDYIGGVILLSGVIVVIYGKQEDHPNKRRGIIGGVLSILCFSVSSVMIKLAIGDIDVISATFYRMALGTIAIMFVGFTSKSFVSWIRPLRDIKLLGLFFLNVIIITFGGFVLSMLAIKNISVSMASILSTTEPVFVLIFAWLVSRDKVTIREIIGASITIVGLIIIILHD